MGAIAGIIYPELFPVTYAIKPALDVLEGRCHAPPKTFLHKSIELGSRGGEITHSQNRSCAAVVDGMLERVDELLLKMRQRGVILERPSTESLIVKAYEIWGEEFLEHLHGAFAIALLDIEKQIIILGRDRLGLKPLYWSQGSRHFVFASELKALLATGLIPQAAAPEAIAAYFVHGYFPQDLSPIEGANKLLPGHYLIVGSETPLRVRPYWSYSALFGSQLSISGSEVTDQLGTLLKTDLTSYSTKDRVGYLSSGRVGSAYLASQLAASPKQADHIGFALHYPGHNDDEVRLANEIAMQLNIHQEVITVTPAQLLENLPLTIWTLDEPLATFAPFALKQLYQAASALVPLLLTDVGTESILAAHRPLEWKQGYRGRMRPFSRYLAPLLGWARPSFAYRGVYREWADPWVSAYTERYSLFLRSMRRRLSPISPRFSPEIFMQRFHQISQLGHGPAGQMYLDVKTRLCDREMLSHDRLAASSSMLWHSPYLDETVVSFMARVPEAEKAPLSQKQHPLRSLLHSSLQGLPLQGSSPIHPSSWLKDPMCNRAFSQLLKGSLVEAGWLSRKWLQAALDLRLRPAPTFQQLWGILVLETWFQLYINRPITHPEASLSTLWT